MDIFQRLHRALEGILRSMTIGLMIGLTGVVVLAVIFRKLGSSFSWYDEVASIVLVWLTYYGAALAALKRSHIGFDGLVLAMPPRLRLVFVVFAEVVVIAFFLVMAWTGFRVLQVLEGDTLVSLTWVPVQFTQSVIPIAACAFILSELVSLPDYWRRVRAGEIGEHLEATKGSGGK